MSGDATGYRRSNHEDLADFDRADRGDLRRPVRHRPGARDDLPQRHDQDGHGVHARPGLPLVQGSRQVHDDGHRQGESGPARGPRRSRAEGRLPPGHEARSDP